MMSAILSAALPTAALAPSWDALAAQAKRRPQGLLFDPARGDPEPEWFGSSDRLLLYRERNGWCPYSERVWLTLEVKGIDYATVLVDNTGPGPRPRGYSGSTPQVRWPETKRLQGESLDLMKELDRRYPETAPLWPPPGMPMTEVSSMVSAFKRAFPSNARPSSRSAFLFGWDGPLARSDFESALDRTEELLAKHEGGFFCGEALSAADIAWAPFLERWAAQLPCLHDGLLPKATPERWHHLSQWYLAMEEQVPAYACRLRGDEQSWQRVLAMQGFGNAGRAPALLRKGASEDQPLAALTDAENRVWAMYTSEGRVCATPQEELAARVADNREAIVRDACARNAFDSEGAADDGLRMVAALLRGTSMDDLDASARESAAAMAAHLEKRVCVPRDMGPIEAAALRILLARL
jgi:glutathione S-transferase